MSFPDPLPATELPPQLKGTTSIQRGKGSQDIKMSTHNVWKADMTQPSTVNAVMNHLRGPNMPGSDAPNPRWDPRLKDLIVHDGGFLSMPKRVSGIGKPNAEVEKIETPTKADTVANEKPIKKSTPAKKAADTSAPVTTTKPITVDKNKILKPGERPPGWKPKSTNKPYWKA